MQVQKHTFEKQYASQNFFTCKYAFFRGKASDTFIKLKINLIPATTKTQKAYFLLYHLTQRNKYNNLANKS